MSVIFCYIWSKSGFNVGSPNVVFALTFFSTRDMKLNFALLANVFYVISEIGLFINV